MPDAHSESEDLLNSLKREDRIKYDMGMHSLEAIESFIKGNKPAGKFDRFLELWVQSGKESYETMVIKTLAAANIENIQSIPTLVEYQENEKEKQKGCGISICSALVFALSGGLFVSLTDAKPAMFVFAGTGLLSLVFFFVGISLRRREHTRNYRSRKITLAGKPIIRTTQKLRLLPEVQLPQTAPIISKIALRGNDTVQCPVCRGESKWEDQKICSTCRGTGRYKGISDISPESSASKPSGWGEVMCRECNGKGRLVIPGHCYFCNGNGFIKPGKWMRLYDKKLSIPFNKRLEKLRPLITPYLSDLNQKLNDLNIKINVWNSKL